MYVDAGFVRYIEDFFRENFPVGDDDEIVNRYFLDFREKLRISSDFGRCENGDLVFDREHLDRRWREFSFSPEWLIGIRHHKSNLKVFRAEYITKHRGREGRGSEEGYSHEIYGC